MFSSKIWRLFHKYIREHMYHILSECVQICCIYCLENYFFLDTVYNFVYTLQGFWDSVVCCNKFFCPKMTFEQRENAKPHGVYNGVMLKFSNYSTATLGDRRHNVLGVGHQVVVAESKCRVAAIFPLPVWRSFLRYFGQYGRGIVRCQAIGLWGQGRPQFTTSGLVKVFLSTLRANLMQS